MMRAELRLSHYGRSSTYTRCPKVLAPPFRPFPKAEPLTLYKIVSLLPCRKVATLPLSSLPTGYPTSPPPSRSPCAEWCPCCRAGRLPPPLPPPALQRP